MDIYSNKSKLKLIQPKPTKKNKRWKLLFFGNFNCPNLFKPFYKCAKIPWVLLWSKILSKWMTSKNIKLFKFLYFFVKHPINFLCQKCPPLKFWYFVYEILTCIFMEKSVSNILNVKIWVKNKIFKLPSVYLSFPTRWYFVSNSTALIQYFHEKLFNETKT